MKSSQGEHGAEYNPDLETKFKDAVQSVIGNKGKVVDAWSYNNSVPGDDYHTSSGYIDWWSEIRGMDGMAPNTYIVICLSTDLEFMSQWLTCFYRDENGNDLTTDYSGDVGKFDPFPLIDKCLKQAGKSEARKPESCKDGKKESMERCDSCGAVMTEYDYDRYGGLCKRCRDKGEAKKSEAGGSVDAQTFPNITDTTLQILKQGGHRVSATTLEDVVADLAYGEAAGSGIFDSSKKISVKDVLKQTINDFDNSPLNIGKGLIEQFAVNNKDRLREIYPIALKECDVELSPDFEDTYNSDDLYPFMKWVIVKVADALYNKVSESKKSESIGSRIKMGIDYNMFMRMCRTAAYLDEDEDYWDALWEYYSEMGEIEDALVFFDNLFQYTAWCDADEVYDEYLDDKFTDDSKSKEECIQAAIDDGDLDAYKHESGNYLVIL